MALVHVLNINKFRSGVLFETAFCKILVLRPSGTRFIGIKDLVETPGSSRKPYVMVSCRSVIALGPANLSSTTWFSEVPAIY